MKAQWYLFWDYENSNSLPALLWLKLYKWQTGYRTLRINLIWNRQNYWHVPANVQVTSYLNLARIKVHVGRETTKAPKCYMGFLIGRSRIDQSNCMGPDYLHFLWLLPAAKLQNIVLWPTIGTVNLCSLLLFSKLSNRITTQWKTRLPEFYSWNTKNVHMHGVEVCASHIHSWTTLALYGNRLTTARNVLLFDLLR